MYSKNLASKVNTMFDNLSGKISGIVNSSANVEQAGHEIAKVVASETATRSKTMLNDMYADLTKKLLATPDFADISSQNRFYELNLRDEIFSKYRFETNDNIDYRAADRTLNSLIAGAGTAAVGGILIFALSPASPVVPIAIVVAASVAAFCVSYYVITPGQDKNKFEEAVGKFLDEIKRQFLAWFDEIERYFDRRVNELKSTF